MSYTKIATIYADSERLGGQEITVGGWARTIRDMKAFGLHQLILLYIKWEEEKSEE